MFNITLHKIQVRSGIILILSEYLEITQKRIIFVA